MREARILLCWERSEENSWNPDLVAWLSRRDASVTEVHDLASVEALDLASFDVCLPRFRVHAAHMTCLDEFITRSGIPMVNDRRVRATCENKALSAFAFDVHGVAQPPWLALSDEGEADRDASWEDETVIKPLTGCRGEGIEICDSLDAALARGRRRGEDLLVQKMIWPARSWRVIVGRNAGIVDPYWRRPPRRAERILSISTGSTIARERSERVERVALQMLDAVDGDLLAVDVLETEEGAYALEINHNFDAHGGTEPAAEAFMREIEAVARRVPLVSSSNG